LGQRRRPGSDKSPDGEGASLKSHSGFPLTILQNLRLRRSVKHLWLTLVMASLLMACGGGGGGGGNDNTPAPEPIPEMAKPNILLIMADDLGVNDISIYNGNTAIDTPNLDALAKDGVRFTQHYADSVCSPARAALLSGQHPVRTGFTPNGRGISPDLLTLPEALSDQGYATWHIGKWHIGETQRQAWPDYQGFDHWFGFLNQWLLAGDHRDENTPLSGPRYNNPWLMGDTESPRYHKGHLEDILTDRALSALQTLADGEKPWFLNLWFFGPHEPVQPAPHFAQNYPDTGPGRYRALISQLDYNIGRVLKLLDQTGQRNNTIVVFLSDNGGTNRYVDSNYPYFGRKGSYYRGAVRTPLIIQWPRSEAAGSVYDGPIAIYDIYPTLMAATDLPIPPALDGLNLLPDITDGKTQQRELFWENILGFAMLSVDGSRWLSRNPWMSPDEPIFLANLDNDPAGAIDEHKTYPGDVIRLDNRHHRWQRNIYQVNTEADLDDFGHGELTAADFLRTPGYGEFTFAIGVERGYQGNLARQDPIWSLRAKADGSVEARFQKVTLNGHPLSNDECYSLVVSGMFSPRIPGIPNVRNHMWLNLYIDGVLVDSYTGRGKMDVKNTAAATIIGEPSKQGNLRLSEPVVLNTTVERSLIWTSQTLDQRACNR
jgi:arylsulfatase A-like enzyme